MMLDEGAAAPLLVEEEPRHVEHEIFLRSLMTDLVAPAATARMLALFRDHYYTAGETIYEEGDISDRLYFLVRGTVRLTSEGEAPWTFSDRSVFGGLDVTLERPRTRTVVATSTTHLVSVAYDEWQEVLEDNFTLSYGIMIRTAAGMLDVMLQVPSRAFTPVSEATVTAAPEAKRGVVDRLVVLRDAPLFARAKVEPLILLARGAEERRLQDGELLYAEGDPGDALHLVADGGITITREGLELDAVYQRGELVGGAAAVGEQPRPFTARAFGPATVLTIQRAQLIDVLEDYFDVTRSIWAFNSRERDRLQRYIRIEG